MQINVKLDHGLLPDKYGKFAPENNLLAGQPITSFPIQVKKYSSRYQGLCLQY